MTEIDVAQLEQWVGKEAIAEAIISVEPANLLAVTLDRDPNFQVGDSLPPAWHWLYFYEAIKASDLGEEGHNKVSGFLPPVPLPRRMWAGGRFTFARSLRLGDRAVRRSTVKSITPKQGRSGQLCFVIVNHEVRVENKHCFVEEQTIVYREAAKPNETLIPPQPAPTAAQISATYTPDPVLLFRYSALTFNGHRIHYDVDYCREVEGYPNLVVHGPLIATLLLDLFYQHYPHDALVSFVYQAHSPLFNPDSFLVNGARAGNTGQVWAANKNGGLAMRGTAEFAIR